MSSAIPHEDLFSRPFFGSKKTSHRQYKPARIEAELESFNKFELHVEAPDFEFIMLNSLVTVLAIAANYFGHYILSMIQICTKI